jgi:hypothetical protein
LVKILRRTFVSENDANCVGNYYFNVFRGIKSGQEAPFSNCASALFISDSNESRHHVELVMRPESGDVPHHIEYLCG